MITNSYINKSQTHSYFIDRKKKKKNHNPFKSIKLKIN